ncbi:MAG: cytochrome c oxidase assembly protein [Gammaproteobacteria bacterium]
MTNKIESRKSYRLPIILFLVVLGMFGFGYAMVPLYNVMCKTLGINGKTGNAAALSSTIDNKRMITVQFLATNNANLPWKFYPITSEIHIHPGQNAQVAFFAENDSGRTMTVQAIPSVTPGVAAKYLKKTECFCFNQQTLNDKQALKMPLIFHIEVDVPSDVHTITLAYTLFDATNIAKKKTGVGRIQS